MSILKLLKTKGGVDIAAAKQQERRSITMGYSKEYNAWDNSRREEFYDDYGNLQTTHVDRYDIFTGEYVRTDVYNSNDVLIDSFKKD